MNRQDAKDAEENQGEKLIVFVLLCVLGVLRGEMSLDGRPARRQDGGRLRPKMW
jgi:hypothetical protein